MRPVIRVVACATLLAIATVPGVAFGSSGDSPAPDALEGPSGDAPDEAAPGEAVAEQSVLEFEHDPLFEDEADELSGFPDPLEPMNRGIFVFNEGVDRFVVAPLVSFYRWVIPWPLREATKNALDNLNTVPVIVNDGLQLEWIEASSAMARLIINTSFGLGGILDTATLVGIDNHRADFGQTLTLAGIPSGPYLILPLLGPSNMRDTAGIVVDSFMLPTTWFFGLGGLILYYTPTAGFVEREKNEEKISALRESSVDFYAAMRSAYYQHRTSSIWERREHRRPKAAPAGP